MDLASRRIPHPARHAAQSASRTIAGSTSNTKGRSSGDRGTVERVAEGVYAWVENTPDRIVVELRGTPSPGRLTVEGGRVILDPLV